MVGNRFPNGARKVSQLGHRAVVGTAVCRTGSGSNDATCTVAACNKGHDTGEKTGVIAIPPTKGLKIRTSPKRYCIFSLVSTDIFPIAKT